MKKLLSVLALLAALSFASAQTTAPAPAKVDASAAIEKNDASGKFQWMHKSFLARARQPMDLLFLGDSITEGWVRAPHVWNYFYGMHRPANFGIGGDKTENVIWRIENGELDGVKPKVVVLMLGTNNSAQNTADEIAAADKKIVELIRAKAPAAKVLVLAIFPRDARKDNQGNITETAKADAAKRQAVIKDINAQLARLDDGKSVFFLDINHVFVGQDGKIPFAIMPDQLHPNAAGYQLWADAMQPTLVKLMK
ncbi:MAG: hypothetical protein HZA93_24810 [Verrucomicrobia bacterium]|nr:hypothetical protein [Verrucomicrobiota bacterium]